VQVSPNGQSYKGYNAHATFQFIVAIRVLIGVERGLLCITDTQKEEGHVPKQMLMVKPHGTDGVGGAVAVSL
jgi:hypothetical protein